MLHCGLMSQCFGTQYLFFTLLPEGKKQKKSPPRKEADKQKQQGCSDKRFAQERAPGP